MNVIRRYHDISCGHRVVGHEGKCRYFHGHNYRIHFYVTSDSLDKVGRVIDFSVLKSTLCEWLERNWDHKFLMWVEDPYRALDFEAQEDLGFVTVPFNPTAENMAEYLCTVIGPQVLPPVVKLIRVQVDETRKCSTTYYHRELWKRK